MEDVAAASGHQAHRLPALRAKALYRSVLERVFDRQVGSSSRTSRRLQAGGTTRALLLVGRESPDGFRLLWRHGPQTAVRRVRAHFRNAGGRPAVVEPYLAAPYVEWARRPLRPPRRAVLNWLDHGQETEDESFIALEAASLRATVTAWTQTFPRGT
jgi:hypothetical protein